MIRNIDDIKNDQEYWYSCVYFKHSTGQLSKSIRETKPLKVKIKRNGENYVQIINSATGSCISHPSYISFNIVLFVIIIISDYKDSITILCKLIKNVKLALYAREFAYSASF